MQPEKLVTRHPGQSRLECHSGVCTEQGKSLPTDQTSGGSQRTGMVRGGGGGLIRSSDESCRKAEGAKGSACSVSE